MKITHGSVINKLAKFEHDYFEDFVEETNSNRKISQDELNHISITIDDLAETMREHNQAVQDKMREYVEEKDSSARPTR